MEYDRGDRFPFDFLNQIEIHLVQIQKENGHHDHIPFNVKGNGIRVFQCGIFTILGSNTGQKTRYASTLQTT